MTKIAAVILAGGSGTRLWPFSRQMFPKQFLALNEEKSLLHATIHRLDPFVKEEDVWVVTSAALATGAGYAQLQGLNYVTEPAARNTAPAIGIMAAHLADIANDPVMIILPADHVIRDVPAFHDALKIAISAAQDGQVVTFGITPTHPETGFGYIRAQAGCTAPVCPVEAFVEKPDLETAKQYLADGNYTWNSGMFVVRASVILRELANHAPAVSAILDEIKSASNGGEDWGQAVSRLFEKMPSDSIDYAVMEKSNNVAVVPCNIGWSDIGSWDAVYDLAEKDRQGNAIKADAVIIDSTNSLLMGQSRTVAAVGIDNLCIIDTPDAVLVADRRQTQKVKQVVDELKLRGGETHIFHRTVQRPWGSYTILEDAMQGYKVKRIDVVAGGRLSLQSHKHRSEHWVVVSGTATVTNGDEVMTLNAGQSTFIPAGHKHRLENTGITPVQIVEVQVGDYLGEDDIIRYDDIYGR